MSELSDKIAYLKGLRAGMDAAADSHEGKLISALVDALDAAADEIKALRSDHEELKEYVDVLDDDLGELEDEFYNDEYDDDDDDDDMEFDEDDVSFDDDDDGSDDDDCDDDCDDDGCESDDCEDGGYHYGHHEHGFSDAMLDQPLTERTCPACGKPISISMRALLNRKEPIVCPHCGQKFRAQTPEDK